MAAHDRKAQLEQRRRRKMAQSAHAFVRGSIEHFYEWITSPHAPTLPEGPAIWTCGDCHVGNLGPLADENGHVHIHLRDFDQCAIANPAFDLCRLALSLAVLARSSDLPGLSTVRILEGLLAGYESAFPDADEAPPSLPPYLRMQIQRAHARSWKALARDRTQGKTLHLPLGSAFWPITTRERWALTSMFQEEAMTRLATQLRGRPDNGKVRVLDAAYWRKGCSSLGRLRYAVLLDIEGAAEGGNDLCLMDIKEAASPIVPMARSIALPKDDAERVLEGARQLSPSLGDRMAASTLFGRPVFVRELLPQDLKLDIVSLKQKKVRRLAAYLGHVVGRAHARQMDNHARKNWCRQLKKNHSRSLNAPSWLWRTTIGLLAEHERIYLEHCRRYVGLEESSTASDRATQH
jgi:uncharacterized protein (DUF2252 family)